MEDPSLAGSSSSSSSSCCRLALFFLMLLVMAAFWLSFTLVAYLMFGSQFPLSSFTVDTLRRSFTQLLYACRSYLYIKLITFSYS